MFRRKITDTLLTWKESGLCRKKAAVVKGLRQVGKTVAVRQFASENYENVVYVDFKKTISARISERLVVSTSFHKQCISKMSVRYPL